jgi:endonuclease-8
MPEGHTIHRLANLHTRLLVGRKLTVTSPQGRFVDGAKRVTGKTLRAVDPIGKHLFYVFDNGLAVHVHLGMHGAFRTLPMPGRGEALPEPVGQVRMRIVGGAKIVELTGPTACEALDAAGVARIRDRLGPDVIDPTADADIVWARVCKSRTPIGLLLMDQSVVSGIGNAYRSDILYRRHVHPLLPVSSVDRKTFDAIWADSVHLLRLGVKLGHIITTEPDDIGMPLNQAGRDDRFLVYRRPTCRRCGAKVMEMTLAGRVCFFCPKEQKLPRGVPKSKVEIRPVLPAKRAGRRRSHGDAD